MQPAKTRAQWTAEISRRWLRFRETTLKEIVAIGQMLIDAKAALGHGAFGPMIKTDLPFGEREAQRYMTIAASRQLSNPTHVSLLPAVVGTLYELARLPAKTFTDLHARGVIRPDMERADLAQALKPTGSTFYAKKREERPLETWDTIDPRLAPTLLASPLDIRRRAIWEPAAGCGCLSAQLRELGCRVVLETDIVPRHPDVKALDFFKVTALPDDVDMLVTNSPWGRLAASFVRHALALARPAKAAVAMLLPIGWITGARVADLTDALDHLIVPRFRARWMTDDEEAALKAQRLAEGEEDWRAAPKMNYTWQVWDFARPSVPPHETYYFDNPGGEPDDEDEEDV